MIEDLTCVILCGGLGKRLHPLTLTVPKPMVDINGKPHLYRQIDYVKQFGVKNFILSVAYLHKQIEAYFGDGSKFDINISYVEDGDKLLGTAGALRKCLDKITSEYALVMNGDILSDLNLNALIDILNRHDNVDGVISSVLVDDPSRYGVIEAENDLITKFVEKGSATISSTINAGIYLIKKSLIESLEENQFLMLENDVFPKCVENRTLFTCEFKDSIWIDIGTIESYNLALKMFGG